MVIVAKNYEAEEAKAADLKMANKNYVGLHLLYKMTRRKVYLLIPLGTIALFLVYCRTVIVTTDVLAEWRHYAALILFLPLILFFFRNYALAITGTALYLLLATFTALAITPGIRTSWLRIGPIETPPIQLLSLGILILFFSLHFVPATDFYLDFQEAQQKKD